MDEWVNGWMIFLWSSTGITYIYIDKVQRDCVINSSCLTAAISPVSTTKCFFESVAYVCDRSSGYKCCWSEDVT